MSLTLSQRLSLKRFTKGEAPRYRVITLNHRRIFILPNAGGISLAVVILLMLIASINYNNSMGFAFTFLLAAVAQASTLYSFKNLSGLQVSIAKSSPCYAGSIGLVNINIQELEKRERWAIQATHLGKHLAFDVAPNNSSAIQLPVTLKHRGWYTPKTITLSTVFPFGLFRAWSPLLFNEPFLVYPKPIDYGTALSARSHHGHQPGAPSSTAGTDDFVGLKPYQQGQHYRHINWRALAAEKGLYSNAFNAEQPAQIWLNWQACELLQTEEKLAQLCFWVLYYEKQNIEYGLRLPHIELSPHQGKKHQYACLKELALYGTP